MGTLDCLRKFYNHWYYQYIVHTGLYMLEIWERRLCTSLLLAFFLMASYTGYLYLPGHIAMLGHFIRVYIFGMRPDNATYSTDEGTEAIINMQRNR